MITKNKNLLCSWSGGKDSCYALIKAIEMGYSPKVLLNVLNEEGEISRSHGIPKHILEAQANAIGIPIYTIASSWEHYEENFTNALLELKKTYDLEYAVFGDIDLQAHRDWEEKVCTKAGLAALLPLWQQNRVELVNAMITDGIKAMITSCNTLMGVEYCGKLLNEDLINRLLQLQIDPCGENGEFHTLVLNCSLFAAPISVAVINTKQHENYCFSELSLL